MQVSNAIYMQNIYTNTCLNFEKKKSPEQYFSLKCVELSVKAVREGIHAIKILI